MTRKEQIMDAAMFFAKKNENIPIPYLDFVEAAEWADRTMVEKMCKWLETINFEKDYIDRADYGGCFFKEEYFINDFRKAMEE